MLVNSVSMAQNSSYSRGVSKNNYINTVTKPYKADEVSFSGLNPVVLKNQLKIFLTQDIWAENLKVKMPETPVEKEVILEILQNRQKLDRFTRLSNEKAKLKSKISYINYLIDSDPLNTNLPKLRKEIENRGNIETVFKTLDKQIELESKKNKPALEYFKEIEKLEDEYLDKHLMKPQKMEKFWYKIEKNNINRDNQYSTKELIDIISNGQTSVWAEKVIAKPLSKKELIMQAEKQYEQYLRENIDIYEGRMNHNDDARNGRKLVKEINKNSIKKYPGVEKNLEKLFASIEHRYTYKIDKLIGVDIYPIGEIWKDMRIVETDMKNVIQDIGTLKEQLKVSPDNKVFNEVLNAREKVLEELKQDWIKGMKYSLKYENINRERFSAAGKLPEYEYLAGENKTIKKLKSAMAVFEQNNSTIPDEYWAEILK